MTERKEAIEACLKLPAVYEDYPFDDNWTAMRHVDNKKVFAFVFRHAGVIKMNLKVLPEVGCYLRQHYSAVQPAYHLNKFHWVSVVLDGSVDNDELQDWITESYRLTK